MWIVLLICVMLLPTHLSHVGFGNYTFIGMDIKSIVKKFFIFFLFYIIIIIIIIIFLKRFRILVL